MRNVRKKGRRKRQKKHISQYKRSVIVVCSVIMLLMIVVSVNGVSLRAKDKAYQAQEAELERQIKEEEERASEIDDLEDYVGTDEYVEQVAKDKLGLVNGNEIIFKAK